MVEEKISIERIGNYTIAEIRENEVASDLDWRILYGQEPLCGSVLSLFVEYGFEKLKSTKDRKDFTWPSIEGENIVLSRIVEVNNAVHEVSEDWYTSSPTGRTGCRYGISFPIMSRSRHGRLVSIKGPLWLHYQFSLDFETGQLQLKTGEYCNIVGTCNGQKCSDLKCKLHKPDSGESWSGEFDFGLEYGAILNGRRETNRDYLMSRSLYKTLEKFLKK